MLINREVILVKTEITYNTDPVPIATDAVLTGAPVKASEGLRMNERPSVRPNITPLKKTYGGRLETWSFPVEMKGSGTGGTPPEVDALLRACGLDSTIVVSTSVTYAPVSTGHESCTLYYYQDGKLSKLTGARGSVQISLEAGNIPIYNFTMTGHISTETDVSLIAPTYDSEVPYALVGVPLVIGGFGAVISKLDFDLGAQLAMPPDISEADGYGEVQITAFQPVGSFDPENTLVATKDFYGEMEGGTTQAINTGAMGVGVGNLIQMSLPATAYTDVSQGDREGIRTLEVPFDAADVTGDDFMSLAFT